MNKRVLVTGANGQLGKTIQDLYSKYKSDLDIVFVSKTTLDITNATELKTFFKSNSFHYCINCAAFTHVEEAEKTPDLAYKVNGEGVKNLAEACKTYKIHLIHISTDYVFDGEKTEPYTIEDIPNPINEYGKSKYLGEQHIQNSLTTHTIIRTSWLYSKIHGKNFYKTILEKAKTEHTLHVTNTQTGCPTDALNLAYYILESIANSTLSLGISHFSDQVAMTWFDFAKQIISENQVNVKVIAKKYSTFAQRPKYSVLK